MGCKTLHFFSPVQMGLPRKLAKLLTYAMQPGLVSPGGDEQAQLLAVLSSLLLLAVSNYVSVCQWVSYLFLLAEELGGITGGIRIQFFSCSSCAGPALLTVYLLHELKVPDKRVYDRDKAKITLIRRANLRPGSASLSARERQK